MRPHTSSPTSLRVFPLLRRASLLFVALGAALSAARAGVYLTSYNFSISNLPWVYTDESLPSPYRLRAKFAGNYHAVSGWNNNWQRLESVPGTGWTTVDLYWVKYDSDYSTILEIGPMNTQSVYIAPNSPPVTTGISAPNASPGQATTIGGTATDQDGNMQYLYFYVNPPDWSGWQYVGAAYAPGSSVSGSVNWTPSSSAMIGTWSAVVHAYDSSGSWDSNGGANASFIMKYSQSVSSQNATVTVGTPFTPAYFGGGGSGAWQFVVAGQTNWGGTATGTLLPPSNTVSASWTPTTASPAGSPYQFWVRRLGDGSYYDSNISGPYYLTVTALPACTVSASTSSVSPGSPFSVTVNATNSRYVNVDQVSPNAGYYGNVTTGNEVPPNGSFYDLGAVNTTASRTLTLTIGTPGTYTFRGAVSDGNGWYYSTSNVSVTVAAVAPTITSNPSSQSVNAGSNVTFTVGASGSTPLSYQWRKNGSNISGANGSSFTLTNVQTSDAANYDAVVSNSYGNATSAAATLTVNTVAPTITTQPASQTINSGQSVTFSVAATGTAPLAYQWRKNGTNISGATNASYTLASVQTGDAAGYSVTVSNGAGSVTSNSATLTVTTFQPIRLAVEYWQAWDYPGISADQYQDVWVDGHDEEDGHWEDTYDENGNWTGSNWVVDGTHWVDGHWESQYVGTVNYPNGQYGSRWDSTAGDFNINSAASGYSAATANRGYLLNSYNPGDLITFHLYGSAPSANCSNYTWSLFSPSGSQITGNWFSGAYAWSFYANYGNGNYRIDVTYQNATGVSPATATVSYYIPVGVVPAPTITVQPTPTSQTVASGTNVSYSVTAPGATSYQWFKDGAPVAGAYYATLTLANAQPANSGSYTVTASNSGGSVTSTAVSLTVSAAAPTITTQPANLSVNAGQTATFTVGVSGTMPFTYQWRKNGANISGATNAAISIANAQTTDAANSPGYSVVVTNSAGSVTSNSATLAVNLVAPTITTQPASQAINSGQSITFSVAATGTAPLTYQWRKNGTNISGATNTSYTLASVQTSDAAGYSVTVSNSAGSATSNSATLTVTTFQPIRLAVEYWQAWDYPGISADQYQDVWVDGHDEEDGHWEDTYDENGNWTGSNWVVDGTHWVDGHWESQYVGTYTYPNGQYGSRWDTTAGTFNINNASSGYSSTTVNRGYFLNTYNYGDLITFHLYGSAPSANCSNYTWALFSPTGSQITGNWFSGSYAWSFYANYGTGYYRIDLSYQSATGVTPANAAVSYYIPVGVGSPSAPTITSQPSPTTQTVAAGTTVTYTVAASGAASYQWVKDGVPLSGAVLATLTLSDVQTSNSGSYYVVASNTAGSATSNTVSLTVNPAGTTPGITTQPQSQTVALGSNATFQIAASGTPAPTYQWQRAPSGSSTWSDLSDGGAYSGTTTATLIVSGPTAAMSGDQFRCVATNSLGSATSNAVAMTVTSINITIHRPQ